MSSQTMLKLLKIIWIVFILIILLSKFYLRVMGIQSLGGVLSVLLFIFLDFCRNLYKEDYMVFGFYSFSLRYV